MTRFGALLCGIAFLSILTSSCCKKEDEVEVTEAQSTKGQFRILTRGGPQTDEYAVPKMNWGVAKTQVQIFSMQFIEEGITDAEGVDTTKKFDPGYYHFLAYGVWNGDSIGGFESEVELKAGNTPQDVNIRMY